MKLVNLYAIFSLYLAFSELFDSASAAKLKKAKTESQKAKITSSFSMQTLKNRAAKVGQSTGSTSTNKKAFNITQETARYFDLNQTFTGMDQGTYQSRNQVWDYKLLLRQLDEVWGTLLRKENTEIDERGMRAYLEIFIKHFEACDKNKDNKLDIGEFGTCMKNDTYLKKIPIPDGHYALQPFYTNKSEFYANIFYILDTHKDRYLNFYDYMWLRLMGYSWQKCTVMGPFIEEVSWECVVDVASGYRTMERSTLRSLYYLGLELGNNASQRNMDFITFIMAMQSINLYARISSNLETDLTKNEFQVALENNILPIRYNKDMLDQMFRLENARPNATVNYNQGVFSEYMDIQTFMFQDFFLRIFSVPSANTPYHLNKTEFETLLYHPLLPSPILDELNKIPQMQITNTSYQMFSWHNITRFNREGDFFDKFLELKSTPIKYPIKKDKNQNLTYVSNVMYELLDYDDDGKIDFYDYGQFIQVCFLYAKFDEFHKGRVLAGRLHTSFKHYSDFPKISTYTKSQAKRLLNLPEDLYLDMYYTMTIFRVQAVMNVLVREKEPSLILETEMRRMLYKLNMIHIPNTELNKCVRGLDQNQVPKYEWECVYTNAVRLTGKFWENVVEKIGLTKLKATNVNTNIVNPWNYTQKVKNMTQITNSTEVQKLQPNMKFK